MIHAYDKSYLSAAQKNLARMLDYLVNDLHYPLETAWQWFVTSELSARFEQGDCSVLVGLSGVELARAVLEQAGEVVPMQKPSYAYDRSPEYWTFFLCIRFYQRCNLLPPVVQCHALGQAGAAVRAEKQSGL